MTSEQLLNVPNDDPGWERWTFAHAECVRQIRAAVLTQKNIILPDYILYPVSFQDLPNWLERVQQSHNDFNSALALAGVDLQDTDVTKERERPAWVYDNWIEINNAMQALKI